MNGDIIVKREIFTDLSVISQVCLNEELSSKDFFVLEDTDRGLDQNMHIEEIISKKIHGLTALPYGSYDLELRDSPKFSDHFYYSEASNSLIKKENWLDLPPGMKGLYSPHQLIWIKNTPGFTYALIHWGNYPKDTDGCLLVGSGYSLNAVTDSVNTYLKYYPKIVEKMKKGKIKIHIVKEKIVS